MSHVLATFGILTLRVRSPLLSYCVPGPTFVWQSTGHLLSDGFVEPFNGPGKSGFKMGDTVGVEVLLHLQGAFMFVVYGVVHSA